LAANKRIIFTDKVELYKNAEEGTATGMGVNTAGNTKMTKTVIGGTKNADEVEQQVLCT